MKSSISSSNIKILITLFVSVVLLTSLSFAAPNLLLRSANAESLGPWSATASYPFTEQVFCVTSGAYIYCVSDGGTDVNYAHITSSGVGTWTATTSYPTATGGQSCVASGGYIYCVAGNNDTNGATTDYYAPLSSAGVGEWTMTTSYPVGEIGLSCTTSEGYIYCVGGDKTTGTGPTNLVYYAALSSSGIDPWAQTTNYPVSVVSESCSASGGFIYCIGGGTQSGYTPVYVTYYAPISSSGVGAWSAGSLYPSSDYLQAPELSCVILGSYAYCIGGASSSVYYASLPQLGGIGTWTSTVNYPIVVGNPSCVVSGTTIICVAGIARNGVYYAAIDTVSSTLTVSSKDTNGNTINGYYTVLFQNNSPLTTGFTPATFFLNGGQTYVVQVQNYGNYVFDYWNDTGSTNQTRMISITQNTTLTAVYRNIASPPSSNWSEILVTSEFPNGTVIQGLYTALFQNGNEMQSGFSTYSFVVSNNQMYQVAVADYGNYAFNHWSNGSTNRFISVTTGSTTMTDLVAIYN